ncbi:MAG: hypothetical protein QOE70_1762 [Chthoniobacter sp.]|nr:hypothetical protein [Chthoniobacter sp.]
MNAKHKRALEQNKLGDLRAGARLLDDRMPEHRSGGTPGGVRRERPLSLAGADNDSVREKSKSVVFSALLPHAPILVPQVGGRRARPAAATIEAMRAVAAGLIRACPEAVLVISPHAPRRPGAFGIWLDPRLEGSLARCGFPNAAVDLPNDLELVAQIAEFAARRKVATWNIRRTYLDYGTVVPLWFIAEAGWSGPTVVVSLNQPGEGGLDSFGAAISSAAGHAGRRLAVIASGDLSHRLTAETPRGYHPSGQLSDRTLIDLLQRGAAREVANIDPALRAAADEDAVDSTIIALAAADWQMPGHRVLSYEGPFGVGYGVALLYQNTRPRRRVLKNAATMKKQPAAKAKAKPVKVQDLKPTKEPKGGGVLLRNHNETLVGDDEP